VAAAHHAMMPNRIIRYLGQTSTSPISNSSLQKANGPVFDAWHRVCECQIVRNAIFILAGVLLVGCASQPAVMQSSNITPPQITGGSTALAFDAPITLGEPSIDISRDDRGPAAFLGFVDESVSSYDVFSFNRQASDRSDRFFQDSFTEKTGTIRR
jgi:hypothetical protein